MPSTTFQTELKKIKELNEDDNIDGFIVQLPISKLDEQSTNVIVDPSKDVDGSHPENWENGTGYEYFYSSNSLEFWNCYL
jgi:methylenetetrahydrofolate dehydrogenase (NADP+)/methenyltetrahydrofolate cyclohydrolase